MLTEVEKLPRQLAKECECTQPGASEIDLLVCMIGSMSQ